MGPYVLPRSLPIAPALSFRRHSHLLTRPMVATNPHARPDPSDGGGQSGVWAGRLPSQVHSSLGPKAAPRPLCFVLSRPPVLAHDRLCLHATATLTVAGAGTKGQLGLSLADAPSALRGAFTHRAGPCAPVALRGLGVPPRTCDICLSQTQKFQLWTFLYGKRPKAPPKPERN